MIKDGVRKLYQGYKHNFRYASHFNEITGLVTELYNVEHSMMLVTVLWCHSFTSIWIMTTEYGMMIMVIMIVINIIIIISTSATMTKITMTTLLTVYDTFMLQWLFLHIFKCVVVVAAVQ